MQLNQYQLQLLEENLRYINELVSNNQKQYQCLENGIAKQLLYQQISCLKQNAQQIKQIIENKKIQQVK